MSVSDFGMILSEMGVRGLGTVVIGLETWITGSEIEMLHLDIGLVVLESRAIVPGSLVVVGLIILDAEDTIMAVGQ